MNVVPNEFTLGFDMRITPTTNLEEFEKTLLQWCKEVGISMNMLRTISCAVFKSKFFPLRCASCSSL